MMLGFNPNQIMPQLKKIQSQAHDLVRYTYPKADDANPLNPMGQIDSSQINQSQNHNISVEPASN